MIGHSPIGELVLDHVALVHKLEPFNVEILNLVQLLLPINVLPHHQSLNKAVIVVHVPSMFGLLTIGVSVHAHVVLV